MFTYSLIANGDIPTLTDILHMRSDVNSAYTFFANTILPKIYLAPPSGEDR